MLSPPSHVGAQPREPRPPLPRRLVLVEWLESYGCSPSWEKLGIINARPLVCRSVGWLLQDHDDCKVVVPHLIDGHDGVEAQACGDMTIPTRAILRILDLSPVVSGTATSDVQKV